MYCMLLNFSSIHVQCKPGLIQVVINFFVLIDAHRVDGCEIHRMSIFLKIFASQNQPRLNDGEQVVGVPNVIDVLDEVVWQQYVVLQCMQEWETTQNGCKVRCAQG